MTSFGSDLILARLSGLHPKAIDLSLGRIERLFRRLGRPEARVAPVVHIAGTNGKGSTLAMLDAMQQAAGRRVQRYVSPHLVRFAERVLFNGEPIDEPTLAEVLDTCEQANADAPITFFEITTAAAFLAFERRPGDLLLLETGLGGRLDATNVIERPLLTLLSPISLDHQGFLGDTIAEIAFEKAGILKPGVPCSVGPQLPEALAVIERRADEVGTPLDIHGRDWWAFQREDRLVVEDRDQRLELPLPILAGQHQIENAGLAVRAACRLGPLSPHEEAISRGLRTAHWPGRLQRITCGPLVELLPPSVELWLDGGHNPAAGAALAASLNGGADPRPLHLIVGMLTTKDESGFLRPFVPIAESVTTVPVPDEPASRDPLAAAAEASTLGVAASAAKDLPTAVRRIAAASPGPARVLICGSLYLAGHVLREHG